MNIGQQKYSLKTEAYSQEALSTVAQNDARNSFLKDFKSLGLPSTKYEDYKYTDLGGILPEKLFLADSQTNDRHTHEYPGDLKIFLINGKLQSPYDELPKGISLSSMTDPSYQKQQDPLAALTLAMSPQVNILRIEKNVKTPLITIIHSFTGDKEKSGFSTLQVEMDQHSEIRILEVVKGQTLSTSYTHSHFRMESNAHLFHGKILLTEKDHVHVGTTLFDLKDHSQLHTLTYSVAGAANRHNINVNLNGPGGHALLNGLYTGREKQHQDCFVNVHHHAPHTSSHQLFKGILDEEARGVFTGKITIHRKAQKVDSSQLNKNLLLSKKAHVDTRPQIEVYADDVKCGHGATVGQMNPEEVFYLESRGIPREKALKTLCHAFTQEVISLFPSNEVVHWLEDHLYKSFEVYALEHITLPNEGGK